MLSEVPYCPNGKEHLAQKLKFKSVQKNMIWKYNLIAIDTSFRSHTVWLNYRKIAIFIHATSIVWVVPIKLIQGLFRNRRDHHRFDSLTSYITYL